MSRWKGLLYKEWIVARPGLAAVMIAVLLAIGVLPFLFHRYISGETSVITYGFVLSSFTLLFLSYMPVLSLFTSLTMDMKRADIWLHSPSSVGVLVGAKALFAVVTTVAAMVWLVFILMMVFLTSGGAAGIPEELGTGVFIGFFGEIGSLVLLISLIQLSVGFLFWSIYQGLRHKFGRILAVPVTFLLFIGSFWLNDKLSGLPAAERLLGAGEFRFPNTERLTQYSDLGIELSGSLAAGGLVVALAVSVLLFWLGLLLFDKKVAGA
ncbi:hypothetical protein [Edaphobacillus lindanitolerans]|nr:hypothetical protein [Edaphobacillus lindanitolerans]